MAAKKDKEILEMVCKEIEKISWALVDLRERLDELEMPWYLKVINKIRGRG